MPNILIKVSGDLKGNQKATDYIRQTALYQDSHIVLVVGGGTEITNQLKRAGYTVAFDDRFNPPRRITRTQHEKLIVGGTLIDEVVHWSQTLTGIKNIQVISPFLQSLGGVPCNINGDDLVKLVCTEFDATYLLTRKDRVKNKLRIFRNFIPPIEVIGIEA